jgi:hypothetical protein
MRQPYDLHYPTPRDADVLSKPSAKFIDGDSDETDYIQLDQKLYPGTLINSINGNGEVTGSVTADVLVEKGQK